MYRTMRPLDFVHFVQVERYEAKIERQKETQFLIEQFLMWTTNASAKMLLYRHVERSIT